MLRIDRRFLSPGVEIRDLGVSLSKRPVEKDSCCGNAQRCMRAPAGPLGRASRAFGALNRASSAAGAYVFATACNSGSARMRIISLANRFSGLVRTRHQSMGRNVNSPFPATAPDALVAGSIGENTKGLRCVTLQSHMNMCSAATKDW